VTTGQKRVIDWQAIQLEYRAGIKTDRQIGRDYGVSHTAIAKRARAEQWDRDLSARIRAKAEAKVARAAVATPVASEDALASEAAIVEAGANLQTNRILAHRSAATTGLEVVAAMFKELGALSHGELQEALDAIKLERQSGLSERARATLVKAFDSALALGGRSTAARNLAGSLATLIEKERQAFGIDNSKPEGETLQEFLATLPEPGDS
jgi:hypothetical protein